MPAVRIGTAGWAIPRDSAGAFPAAGSGLERYAARFGCVEINSSFHRPHRLSTWERWHASTPDGFRFSVKLPKTITHEHKLIGVDDLLDGFLEQAHALREKLAVLLVQLPPKLEFSAEAAGRFFRLLASRTSSRVVCEPRHASWFTADADRMLADYAVARAAADPAVCDAAAVPGGARSMRYWRLHGSPVMYRSSYRDRIVRLADLIGQAAATGETWCIFDNTASSAALPDALALDSALNSGMPVGQ